MSQWAAMQARSALFDLYGDHLRSQGGAAPVAALVRLLGPLGITAPAVRTAVSGGAMPYALYGMGAALGLGPDVLQHVQHPVHVAPRGAERGRQADAAAPPTRMTLIWVMPAKGDTGEMSELALIERIASRTRRRPGTLLGIGDDAALLGINTRDPSADTALAFMRGVGVDFPSFYDQGGEVLLEFPRPRPTSLPSTAVLDPFFKEPTVSVIADIVDEASFLELRPRFVPELSHRQPHHHPHPGRLVRHVQLPPGGPGRTEHAHRASRIALRTPHRPVGVRGHGAQPSHVRPGRGRLRSGWRNHHAGSLRRWRERGR